MVFQHFMLADNLTVWENVELSLRRPSKGVMATLLGRDRADARERIECCRHDFRCAVDGRHPLQDLRHACFTATRQCVHRRQTRRQLRRIQDIALLLMHTAGKLPVKSLY